MLQSSLAPPLPAERSLLLSEKMLRGEVLAQAMVHEKKGAGLKVVKVTGSMGGTGQSDREQLIDCVDLSGIISQYDFVVLCVQYHIVEYSSLFIDF